VLPRDFDTIEVPFPERGEPELIHWPDRLQDEGGLEAAEASEPVADTAR
jgi:hypothetical protein